MTKAAREMMCSVCSQSAQPKHARPGSLRDDSDFNDRISIDGVTWTNHQGQTYQTYHFIHVVDWATNFNVAQIAPAKSSEAVIQTLVQMWLNWAGAPGELVMDSGTELNSEEFSQFLQANNIRANTICPEAHYQNGKAERHGAILQHMLTKFDVEHPIQNYQDLQNALWWCTQSKNACSLNKGYAPEVLVLGKHTRLPGSVSSDQLLPAHCLADADTGVGLQFRQQLAMRETARRAFHSADNDAALRKAVLRRSNPHRGNYSAGEWVMIWRQLQAGNTNGVWLGPMKVVIQEGQQTIWTTMTGKLYRSAPENVRPITALEAQKIIVYPNEPSIQQYQEQIQRQQTPQETISLNNNQMPTQTPIQPNTIEIPATPPEVNPPQRPTSPASSQQPDQEPDINNEQIPEISKSTNSAPSPESVPIPESDDDELICEGIYCVDADVNALEDPTWSQDAAWKMEIVVNEDDIQAWRQSSDVTDMAFIVSAAKKQRAEVKLSSLSSSEVAEFDKAKTAEIQNWLKTDTVRKILRNQVSEEQILRCRWILTWKPLDPSDVDPKTMKTHKAKARLVVLGYLDPKITEIPRDSPTLSRHSKLLILQLIASMGWNLRSFDVKAAFLQGKPQSDRVLGLEPVPELRSALHMHPNEICQLTKGAYGLIDAPYLWYRAFKDELLRLGFQESPFDPCTFVLRCPKTGVPEGILGIHVDDGICGGNQRFQSKIQELEKVYPFGSQKLGQFTFTGIDMYQHPNKAITMSQENYIKKILPIPISLERRKDEEAVVTPEERQALRALIGSLQYASVHTRPDLASRLSFLQSEINSAKIATLLEANRALHEAKRHHDVAITIQPILCEDLRFLAFSDASFASKKVPDSHTGCMIMSTHKDIGENISCPVNPLLWGCKKIQRVVTSTLAAETVSLSSVLDQLSWIRLCWGWMLDPKIEWQKPEKSLPLLPESFSTATLKAQQLPPSIAATDCKSLYDLVTRTAPPNCTEFRTQLHARMIKDLIQEGVNLRWVHTGAQLADSLTKVMENSFLRATLKGGKYKLNDELEILKARSHARNRLKWLKTCESQSCNDDGCFLALNFWVLGVWKDHHCIHLARYDLQVHEISLPALLAQGAIGRGGQRLSLSHSYQRWALHLDEAVQRYRCGQPHLIHLISLAGGKVHPSARDILTLEQLLHHPYQCEIHSQILYDYICDV